ncbi:uncharacterized protein LOC116287033 [Actinia tenebrosa]|uniref:Uncharacterized protein LOC116287033 n=1 Tax=Actinia tenebrosa TaxID=6105 RepID=A0A6P8H278_ACTTE|nr:uncharacterized protein LOC116287033 [Actinia tenebrosa]
MGLFLKEMIFFYGIISISCASQSFSYEDTVLTGSVIKTLLHVDWFQCLELCISTSECLSYNFCKNKRNTGVCELNSCGLDTVQLCGQNEALRYQKHCVFHHFKENQPRLMKCLVSHQDQDKESMVTGNVTCTSGSISIYADGNPTHMITKEGQSVPVVLQPCPFMSYPLISLQLPRGTKVISIEVYKRNNDEDSGGALIRGGFSDGLVTSTQWKCAYADEPEWRLPSFNDNLWPYAKVAHASGYDDEEDIHVVGIPDNAKWIEYAGAEPSRRTLCRIKRKL